MTIKNEKLLTVLTAATMFVILGIAGIIDYETEQDQITEYKMMVCAGYWPDYDNRKPVCP